jgi:hypothetical protein
MDKKLFAVTPVVTACSAKSITTTATVDTRAPQLLSQLNAKLSCYCHMLLQKGCVFVEETGM